MAQSPPVVVTDAVQVRLLFAVTGQAAIQVLHAITTGPVTVNQTLANTIGASIKNSWATGLAAQMASSTIFARVGLRDLRNPNLPEFLDTNPIQDGDETVTDALPAHLACCITLRTSKAGRSFQGRTYLSGWAESTNGPNGTAETSVGQNSVNFITAIDTTLKANGMALGVLSRPAYRQTMVKTTFYNDGSSEAETMWQTTAKTGAITQVSVIQNRDNRWETQRRRSNSRSAVPTLLMNPVLSDVQEGMAVTQPASR